MGKAGLKRGSEQWNENLSNLQKEHEAERTKLRTGATAQELKEHGEKLLRGNNWYDSYRPSAGYRPLSGLLNHLNKYPNKQVTNWTLEGEKEQFINSIVGPIQQTWNERKREASRKRGFYVTRKEMQGYGDSDFTRYKPILNRFSQSEMDKAIKQASEQAEKRWEDREKAIQKQYEAGNWFGEYTDRVYVGGDAQEYQNVRRTGLTDAGRRRMNELITGVNSPFGRPMAPWEAIASLKYGINAKEQTEEEAAQERATSAAANSRTGREAAMAESEEAQQKSSSSPWARQDERGVLESFGMGG